MRLNLGRSLTVDAKDSDWSKIPAPKELSGGKTYPYGIQIDDMGVMANKKGYDSLIVKNVYDQAGHGDQYIVFNPTQIKSADPVTYDDRGEPIPLSQRFDSTNPDIRY